MTSRRAFGAVIFDVDGVLLNSPHERAWRETLDHLMRTSWKPLAGATSWAPGRFTAELYETVVSGRPRLDGARAALEHFGVPGAEDRAVEYARLKQDRVVELIERGEFRAYPDALRIMAALRAAGLKLAAASSSRNAAIMLARVTVEPDVSLLDWFDADVSGRELPHGKPAPDIFLAAAAELGADPAGCIVVEDAPAGIRAARAGGMAALAVARAGDADMLASAGADLVVTSLDDIDVEALADGRLALRQLAVGDS
jgi:HAD superfamily hydrolase (TIGR01509 family)